MKLYISASLNKCSLYCLCLFSLPFFLFSCNYSLNLFSLQALYMFYALAIVCDDFFVPSLEKICEVRKELYYPFRNLFREYYLENQKFCVITV